MGKTSKVDYPAYTTGTVSLNGQKKASVSKSGNSVNTEYNMSDVEKQLYDFAQGSMLERLPKLDVFDNNVRTDLQKQVDAYKNNAMNTFNQLYGNSLKNITNDVASRFGNLDNSMFLNNLASLENSRTNALGQLAQDIQSYKSDLYNQELSNRYNYLALLNNLVNGTNGNALNYMGVAYNNANSGNMYNNAMYNADLQNNRMQNYMNTQYLKLLSSAAAL